MRGMRLLAVDTTSAAGSVAFLAGEELRGLVGTSGPGGHSEKLLAMVDRLLGELAVPLSSVEAFAVAVGPGSFTGLRIGVAAVEGLAFTTGRPVVGVSALEATAFRYRFRPGLIVSLVDARRGEVFGEVYRSDGARLESVLTPVCEPPDRFLNRIPREPLLMAGSGVALYRELIGQRLGERARLAEPSPFLAEEVARIGRRLHLEGRAAPLGGLRAIYLRPSDAEKARSEQEKVAP